MNRFTDRRRVRAAGLASAIMLAATIGALPASAGADDGDAARQPAVPPAQVERDRPVACLLPADVDRLGSQVTRLGPRREVQLTPEACAARGGESRAEDERPPRDQRGR